MGLVALALLIAVILFICGFAFALKLLFIIAAVALAIGVIAALINYTGSRRL